MTRINTKQNSCNFVSFMAKKQNYSLLIAFTGLAVAALNA
jgi:hypothetical protein